ncbi:hypothetical protein GA0115256_12777, partial [Streptomyces sp. DconLS]
AGAASWGHEEQLRDAGRQLLLAAALATRARAGYHGARHRRAATALLDDVLVGPATEDGRLTAFAPVAVARPSPSASTRPCTPPARPSTTGAPPAAWTPSTAPSKPASAAS